MNILFVTATYAPSANGVAISTARTARFLHKMGHTVGVIGPKTSFHEPFLYIPLPTVFGIPFLPPDYPLPIPIIKKRHYRVLDSVPWDIIHAQHPASMVSLAKKLGNRFETPVVFTYHTLYDAHFDHHLSWLPHRLRNFLYKKTVISSIEGLHGTIVRSRWIVKRLRPLLPEMHFHVIQSGGIPDEFYDAKPIVARALKRPIFLAVSRLSKEKNIDLLISAVALWCKKHSQGQFVLVGEGREKSRLASQVKQFGIVSRVHFTGKVSDEQLLAWYKSADIFLYSSITDTVGQNIMEAMATGLPVVAPRHITTEEIIQDNYNGMLTGPCPQSFYEGIKKGLADRRRLSAGAKQTAKAFSITQSAKKLLSVYEEVISDCQA